MKIEIDKFGAVWCKQCSVVDKVLDQLKEKHPDVIVNKIDIEDNPRATMEAKVRGIPTLKVYKDGELTDTISGNINLDTLEHTLYG